MPVASCAAPDLAGECAAFPISPHEPSRVLSIILKETFVETSPPAGRSWLWLILLIPYIALLWLPFYNDTHPSLAGFPFFYWYQFLWVPLTSLLIYIVYRGLK
ncbi:hypothetical protein OKW34_002021 [Paraburkholderia youngii]